jgi:hypothetical protein
MIKVVGDDDKDRRRCSHAISAHQTNAGAKWLNRTHFFAFLARTDHSQIIPRINAGVMTILP